MNVFVDTSIVNWVLDLNKNRQGKRWEEGRTYLRRLLDGPVLDGTMTFIVNPTVMEEIRDTPDTDRRKVLMSAAERYKFTEFTMTIFPFSFPARFLSKEQKDDIESICMRYPSLTKDQKILADAVFGENIDVLLTTDEDLVRKIPLLRGVKVMLPRGLWELSKQMSISR